jgi:hypothetical protein
MLPVEPGSEADRILRDHRAMEALRRHKLDLVWYQSGCVVIGGEEGTFDDPADALLYSAAAIEAASTDSGQRQA